MKNSNQILLEIHNSPLSISCQKLAIFGHFDKKRLNFEQKREIAAHLLQWQLIDKMNQL